MSTDFILPDIGEGIVECEVVDWLIAVGDTVVEDQPVADVMTDKALVQIPSMYNGVVEKLYYEKGDIAKVHEPLFAITQNDDVSVNDVIANSDAKKNVTEPKVAEPNGEVAAVVSANNNVEDFILPDIGEGIIECEVVEWLVSEGETIKEDQPVCEVMTDKAMVQIPSKYDGKIEKLYFAKGETAFVHKPLFSIQVHREGAEMAPAPQTQEASTPAAATNSQAPAQSQASVQSQAPAQSQAAVKAANGKAVASPAVRRLAREKGIDISQVAGSGKKGRVYKQDLVNFLAQGQQPAAPTATQAQATAAAPVSGGTRVEPIRGVKAAMAKAMTESVTTIPHFTYCDEVDMTKLVALRKRLKEKYAKQEIKLTMMPFFMKAMSLALNEFPIMNSQPNADCTELTYIDDHNIGMAVDSKVGLLVPNVKQCQNKSILDLAKDITELTNSAREGRVSPDLLKGGTITISNIGALGGTVATPIINKPEVAIVALGKVQQLPRFNDKGEVEACTIMQVSWSGDHRIIDGGTIARFVNLWKSYLEDPSEMLVAMS